MPTVWEDVPESLRCDIDIVADAALTEDPQARMLSWLAHERRPLAYTPHNGGHWLIFSHALAILCFAMLKDLVLFLLVFPPIINSAQN